MKKRITVRISELEKRKLEYIAREKGCTLSEYLLKLIEEFVRENEGKIVEINTDAKP